MDLAEVTLSTKTEEVVILIAKNTENSFDKINMKLQETLE